MEAYYSAKFSWKLHENEDNWAGSRGREGMGFANIMKINHLNFAMSWRISNVINSINLKENETFFFVDSNPFLSFVHKER